MFKPFPTSLVEAAFSAAMTIVRIYALSPRSRTMDEVKSQGPIMERHPVPQMTLGRGTHAFEQECTVLPDGHDDRIRISNFIAKTNDGCTGRGVIVAVHHPLSE